MNPPGQRYDKPTLNENDLLERYIERSLTITDRNRAARYLRHIEAYSWGVCEHESEDGGDGGFFTASTEGAVACADADVC